MSPERGEMNLSKGNESPVQAGNCSFYWRKLEMGQRFLAEGGKAQVEDIVGQFEGVFGSSVGLKRQVSTGKWGKRVWDKTLEKLKYQPWVEKPNCPRCARIPGLVFQVLVAT